MIWLKTNFCKYQKIDQIDLLAVDWTLNTETQVYELFVVACTLDGQRIVLCSLKQVPSEIACEFIGTYVIEKIIEQMTPDCDLICKPNYQLLVEEAIVKL